MSASDAMTAVANESPRSVIEFDEARAAGVLADVKELHPMLKRNAVEHERVGKLTDEVVDALDSRGVFRMSAPHRWRGLCMSLRGRTEVVSEIARACPSTAWVTVVFNNSALGASVQRPDMQRRLLSDGVSRICAPGPGGGTVEPDGRSFVVSGRWSIGSGLHHADWVLVPAVAPEGSLKVVALPATRLRIERTWHVAGMKGTGSDTVIADQIPVEADQITDMEKAIGNHSYLYDDFPLEPTDYVATFPAFRTEMLAVLVGTVAGLIEAIISDKQRAYGTSSYQRRMDSPVYQARMGEIYSSLWAARAILRHASSVLDDAAQRRAILTSGLRIENKGEVLRSVAILKSAVDKAMDLAGASGFADEKTVQRFWRDFCMASRHTVWNEELGHEIIGREMLGIEENIVPPAMF